MDINSQLQYYNARVTGSNERKRQRLQRFIEQEKKQERAKKYLKQLIRREQQKVRERALARKNEILETMNTDSPSRCHVLSVIFQLVLALTIVGALWNFSRPIVFKV